MGIYQQGETGDTALVHRSDYLSPHTKHTTDIPPSSTTLIQHLAFLGGHIQIPSSNRLDTPQELNRQQAR